MRASTPKDSAPYDDNQPLQKCITTDGGQSNTHPSGKRTFNLQELACLAGFSTSHRFSGCMTSIRKQIGNAVPACFAKTLFKEIIGCLEETDRMDAEWKPEVIALD